MNFRKSYEGGDSHAFIIGWPSRTTEDFFVVVGNLCFKWVKLKDPQWNAAFDLEAPGRKQLKSLSCIFLYFLGLESVFTGFVFCPGGTFCQIGISPFPVQSYIGGSIIFATQLKSTWTKTTDATLTHDSIKLTELDIFTHLLACQTSCFVGDQNVCWYRVPKESKTIVTI